MKRSMNVAIFSFFAIATSVLLLNTMVSTGEGSTPNDFNLIEATFVDVDLKADTRKPVNGSTCGYLMDVNVGTGDSYYSKTSASVGSCTDIESCITYGGGSGSFYTVYSEIPSGGGSPIVKYNKLVTAPWSGCAHAITDPPVFSVNTNSQIKVEVISNSGVASTHQVDAN